MISDNIWTSAIWFDLQQYLNFGNFMAAYLIFGRHIFDLLQYIWSTTIWCVAIIDLPHIWSVAYLNLQFYNCGIFGILQHILNCPMWTATYFELPHVNCGHLNCGQLRHIFVNCGHWSETIWTVTILTGLSDFSRVHLFHGPNFLSVICLMCQIWSLYLISLFTGRIWSLRFSHGSIRYLRFDELSLTSAICWDDFYLCDFDSLMSWVLLLRFVFSRAELDLLFL